MKSLSITIFLLGVITSLAPIKAFAQCDQFIGKILSEHLKPVIESADCPFAKKAGLDKKGHRLGNVCYESSGPTSHIRIETHLNCHGSKKGLFAFAKPSVSEDVAIEAEVRGSDCHLNYVRVKPSGEMGKALTSLFDANKEARKALEQGLTTVCNK